MPLSDRAHYNLRKLHSLTGILPVGLFLVEHFVTNSFATFGARAYDEKVEFLRSLPYLFVLEIAFIGVPLAFHALLGVWIWWSGRSNPHRYGYRQNWLYSLQRWTGLFLLVFITVHVWGTRLSHNYTFASLTEYLASPALFVFYLLGVLAASFHFGNGLWGFLVTWGVVTGRVAQRRTSWVCLAVFLLFALVGVNSLLAFRGKAVTLFHEREFVEAPAGAAQEAKP
jgi:succinate dehydrogenase / fumarate reductase cytochrome b subunit